MCSAHSVCSVIPTPFTASDWLCLLKDPEDPVFCRYPFLFPLEFRVELLKIHAFIVQVKQVTECVNSACLRETLLITSTTDNYKIIQLI